MWFHDDDGVLCSLGATDDGVPTGAAVLDAHARRRLVRGLGEHELARLWHAHAGGLAGTDAPDPVAARRWLDDALDGATAQLCVWRIAPTRGPAGSRRDAGPSEPLDLRALAPPARPEHWVEIRVIDEADAPVARVAVTLVDAGGARRSTTTDDDGVARWRNVVAGATRVVFDDPNAAYARS